MHVGRLPRSLMSSMTKAIYVLALAVIVLFFVFIASRRVPVAIRTNIGGITASNQTWQIMAPKGHHFNLLIGFPTPGPDSAIAGQVAVRGTSAGSEGVTWAFDGASCQEANWLRVHGLSALLLNWTNGGVVRLDSQIQHGAPVSVSITFKGAIPTNASLWLSYIKVRSLINR